MQTKRTSFVKKDTKDKQACEQAKPRSKNIYPPRRLAQWNTCPACKGELREVDFGSSMACQSRRCAWRGVPSESER